MIDWSSSYAIAVSVVLSLMISLWLFSLVLKDASIVDRFWGAGFVFVAWALYLTRSGGDWNQLLLMSLVSIWGLRLSIYIHRRNSGHPEDYRYAEMRSHHGNRFWWYSLISVFLLQGALMLIVAMPVIAVLGVQEKSPLSMWSLAGSVLWLIGFVFEAGGDYQLAKFKSDPANKGKLMTSGLWSLTRHPNYFGDACQWWAFGLFAFALSGGWVSFLGPIVMTAFIFKVSGVMLMEKSLSTKKPGYSDYVKNVPAFVPKVFGIRIFVFASILGFGLGLEAPARASEFQKELPFKRIEFVVKDLAKQEVLSVGRETIVFEGDVISKNTEYFLTSTLPADDKESVQTEQSKVQLSDLRILDYYMINRQVGEEVKLAPVNGSEKYQAEYRPKKDTPMTKDQIEWTKKMIVGKTLHHLIVRKWSEIKQSKDVEFRLLVPMKRDSFSFRVRKSSDITDKNKITTSVLSLEPTNWAIRSLVPKMDFHYQVLDSLPTLVRYEGATTIPINGDDKRLVSIDFSYIK
jgi:steroid 5-alpha reductase family enzyme